MSWKGLDHGTIYEMVVNQGAGPEISRAAEDGWRRIQDVIVDAESGIRAAMRASENDWEGSGADAMRTGYTPLGAWVLSAAADASRTATAVTEQAAMAANTRRLVADNPPPQNVGEHLHSFFGGLDGNSVYLDQAAAVDQLMTTYEKVSVDNQQRFDTWSVPPSVVVTPAAAPSGPGGAGVGAMPDTGGVAPAGGGSSIASALSPGASGAGGGALPAGAGGAPAGGAVPAGAMPGGAGSGGGGGTGPAGAGSVPGVGGMPSAGAGGAGAATPGAAGAGAAGAGAAGAGAAGAGAGGMGAGGLGAGGSRGPGVAGSGPGAPGPGAGGSGAGRAVAAGAAPGSAGRGTPGLGTGGVARPSLRPPGSPGGSGTGPGPWSRAATEAGRSPAGATPFRSVVPAVPPRTPLPDWRSVLLPPEREAATSRAPGETAARSAGPGAPGGGTATPAAAAAQGSGARGAGSPGMHAPMMGGGAGGAQPEGRRRASYLVDDSDAFVDKRWFTEPVITPDDPL